MLKPRRLFIPAVLAALVSVFANTAFSAPTNAPAPARTDDAQQIQKQYDQDSSQIRELYRALGKINPLSQAGATGQNGVPGLSADSFPPELLAQVERIQKLLDQPWMRKYLKLLSDPAVERDFQVLLNSPQRVSFLFWELGWVVFILILKIWRTMKARRFMAVIFVQLWTFSLLLFGLFCLVPRLVFGPAYSNLIRSIMSVMNW